MLLPFLRSLAGLDLVLATAVVVWASSLATYRLAGLIVYDDLPFDIMLRLRIKAGVYRTGEDGRSETQVGRLLGCVHCVGIFVSLVVSFVVFSVTGTALAMWVVIAGAQSLMEARSVR